jgi:uncharacterized protein (TIGR02246 family)
MSLRMIAVSVVAFVLAGTGSAAASGPTGSKGNCHFDAAVQTYLRTTDQRDARGFNALLHRDVTGVLPGGVVFNGRTEMAAFIDSFFARTDWTQTFDLKRETADCETGYVLFESVYAEPAAGYSQTLMIGLTWTRERGRWLVLADQNTEVS